jgi:hypothetical protein
MGEVVADRPMLGALEVYRLLTIDRRWSADRYQTWLANTLAEQLLG